MININGIFKWSLHICLFLWPLLCTKYPEDGGVPLNVLRDELIKLGATENIPRAKIDLLVQKADEDRDGMLDYSEFVKLVIF